eukprot:GHVN01035558.1.p1 GENE.GHVN01035558.1~~GHVN01035558.1.p1  ORF type:complete len:906 (-),score=148.03 GHVN01035558.1:667-3384(-)
MSCESVISHIPFTHLFSFNASHKPVPHQTHLVSWIDMDSECSARCEKRSIFTVVKKTKPGGKCDYQSGTMKTSFCTGDECENLTQSRLTSITGSKPTNPGNVIDGNLATEGWDQPGSKFSWFEIDLGRDCEVFGVSIKANTSKDPINLKVELFTAGKEIILERYVPHLSLFSGELNHLTGFDVVGVRYVKVTGLSTWYWGRLRLLEVVVSGWSHSSAYFWNLEDFDDQASKAVSIPESERCDGTWGEWSECDETCARYRSFMLKYPTPEGASPCLIGDGYTEVQPCMKEPCSNLAASDEGASAVLSKPSVSALTSRRLQDDTAAGDVSYANDGIQRPMSSAYNAEVKPDSSGLASMSIILASQSLVRLVKVWPSPQAPSDTGITIKLLNNEMALLAETTLPLFTSSFEWSMTDFVMSSNKPHPSYGRHGVYGVRVVQVVGGVNRGGEGEPLRLAEIEVFGKQFNDNDEVHCEGGWTQWDECDQKTSLRSRTWQLEKAQSGTGRLCPPEFYGVGTRRQLCGAVENQVAAARLLREVGGEMSFAEALMVNGIMPEADGNEAIRDDRGLQDNEDGDEEESQDDFSSPLESFNTQGEGGEGTLFTSISSTTSINECSGQWGPWGVCDRFCRQQRSFFVINVPHNEAPCPTTEFRGCTEGDCIYPWGQIPIVGPEGTDCKAVWHPWTQCGDLAIKTSDDKGTAEGRSCLKLRRISILQQAAGRSKQCPASIEVGSCCRSTNKTTATLSASEMKDLDLCKMIDNLVDDDKTYPAVRANRVRGPFKESLNSVVNGNSWLSEISEQMSFDRPKKRAAVKSAESEGDDTRPNGVPSASQEAVIGLVRHAQADNSVLTDAEGGHIVQALLHKVAQDAKLPFDVKCDVTEEQPCDIHFSGPMATLGSALPNLGRGG